jgi:glucose-6-phosphate isomerase
MLLDFESGRFASEAPQARRTLGELKEIFADPNAVDALDADTVVYEIHGGPSEVEGAAKLLYATTILHPGDVRGEFFMTRGHFHTRADRGELVFTLRGSGTLLLMDRLRKSWTEDMRPGSVHDVDGAHAHRVANTGSEPLIFLVAWMSDCGHDYETILREGFSTRLFATPD